MINCSFTEGYKYKCNLLGVFLNFGIDIVESHRLCIVCSFFCFIDACAWSGIYC